MTRGRSAVILTIALVCGIGILVAFGNWYYVCNMATYACPANGCGNVPQQNCANAGSGLLEFSITITALTAVGVALTLLWPPSREPHP